MGHAAVLALKPLPPWLDRGRDRDQLLAKPTMGRVSVVSFVPCDGELERREHQRSMYYYFEGKEALYADVTTVELGRLLAEAGPFPIPKARDPESFWSTLEGFYLRLMRSLADSPRLATLARDWLLIAVVFSMGQAMDGWLMMEQPDGKALRRLVRLLVGMMRRALSP